MSILIAFALLLIVAAAAVAGIVYGGLVDVAATASEPGPLRWLLETTRERSISRRAEGIRVPDLSGEALAAAGASGFDDMCASCHGAPRHAPFVAAQDMSPPPPRLDRGGGNRAGPRRAILGHQARHPDDRDAGVGAHALGPGDLESGRLPRSFARDGRRHLSAPSRVRWPSSPRPRCQCPVRG
jgi:cytochrome c553